MVGSRFAAIPPCREAEMSDLQVETANYPILSDYEMEELGFVTSVHILGKEPSFLFYHLVILTHSYRWDNYSESWALSHRKLSMPERDLEFLTKSEHGVNGYMLALTPPRKRIPGSSLHHVFVSLFFSVRER